MTVDLRKLIEEKSGGIQSSKTGWSNAVSRAENSGIQESSILTIAKVFQSPTTLIKLCESASSNLKQDDFSLLGEIEKRSSDSAYTVEEWLQAMEVLVQYLIRAGRSSSLDMLLGYLACSADYLSQSVVSPSFSEGVADFLEEFGFEG